MTLSTKAIALYNLLSVGQENAKPRKELANLLNIDTRTVSQLSSQLVKAGVPVGSIRDGKMGGLFIISSQTELQTATYSVENDALESMQRVHKLRGIDLANWQTEFSDKLETQKNQLQNM
ncbi:hypothetical protein ACFQGR_04575 [Weissella sagaensis]|uniref:HTH domain-containing protein n=1 Tax=Weissella sagaensis TaxID=2559928 RepID=A0ABW1RT71_9LACO|nr:Rrf2 family transcriptional regulator [Weissella sagaensis]